MTPYAPNQRVTVGDWFGALWMAATALAVALGIALGTVSVPWAVDLVGFLIILFGLAVTLLEALDKALAYGSHAPIANRAFITFAYNPTSNSLYMRYGMYPREALYAMRGASANLRPASVRAEAVGHERAGAGPESLEILSQIDEHVLGFAREQHHRYLLAAPGASCHVFRSEGAVHGYAYVWASGRVGPLAVTSPSRLAPVMNAALELAVAENTDSVSIIVAGSNEEGVAIALDRGMRIASPLLLMSTKPFGNWGSYLFHSPGLL